MLAVGVDSAKKACALARKVTKDRIVQQVWQNVTVKIVDKYKAQRAPSKYQDLLCHF